MTLVSRKGLYSTFKKYFNHLDHNATVRVKPKNPTDIGYIFHGKDKDPGKEYASLDAALNAL